MRHSAIFDETKKVSYALVLARENIFAMFFDGEAETDGDRSGARQMYQDSETGDRFAGATGVAGVIDLCDMLNWPTVA